MAESALKKKFCKHLMNIMNELLTTKIHIAYDGYWIVTKSKLYAFALCCTESIQIRFCIKFHHLTENYDSLNDGKLWKIVSKNIVLIVFVLCALSGCVWLSEKMKCKIWKLRLDQKEKHHLRGALVYSVWISTG